MAASKPGTPREELTRGEASCGWNEDSKLSILMEYIEFHLPATHQRRLAQHIHDQVDQELDE